MANIVMPDGSKKSFPGVVFVGGKYFARMHTADGYRYLCKGQDTPEAAHRVYVEVRQGRMPIPPRKNQRHKAKISLNEAISQALERCAAGRGLSEEDGAAFTFNRQTFSLIDAEIKWLGMAPLARYHWMTACKSCNADVSFWRWAHDVSTPVSRFCEPCQAKAHKRAELVETVEDGAADLV